MIMVTKSPIVTRILTVFCITLVLAFSVLSIHPVEAAEIFVDGFESGDFSKWSPTGGSPSVTSGEAHHGNYKAILDAAGEYAQARFAAVDHCFMRAYVMFKTFPTTGNEVTILGLWSWSSSRYMTEARIINDNGTVKWRMQYHDGGAYYNVNSEQQKPSLNTWYCVEVEVKSNTITNAESRIYINGAELTDITQTGKNNGLQINSGYIWVNAAVTHWYDCVVVDTAYIGPERSYLSVNSPYGTTSGQGWYDYGSTAHAGLDAGGVDHGNGTRRIFANWSGDATGTDYASSDPITMTSNKTALALWQTQYNVTFTQAGLDASASGTVATVNGVSVAYNQLPYSVWVDNDDTVTYSYDNVSSTTGGKRFTLTSVSGQTSPITVTSPTLVQGNYVTQYQVVFDQTGVGSDFTGAIVTIDEEDYAYTSLPAEFWWDDGSLHTFSFASPLVVNDGKQYNWASTSGLSSLQSDTLIISGSGSVTGNYGTQIRYQITFNATGVTEDYTDTVVTIDDIDYTQSQLPISFWWDEGSSHTFSFQSPLVVTANSKQYVWTGTTGLSTLQSETITVIASGEITASYKTQYYLEVASAYDSPTPTSGWFDVGTEVTSFVTSPWPGPDRTRYVCTGWTGTGSTPVSGTENTVTFMITQASTISWNWKTQYTLSVSTNPEDLTPQPLRDPVGETESPTSWWYDASTDVTLTAQTVAEHTFDYWTVDGLPQDNGLYQIVVTMLEPHTAVAHYSLTGTSDIAVNSVHTSRTVIGQIYYDQTITINVTVENQGNHLETFNITVQAGSQVVAMQENVALEAATSTIVTFIWDTTSFALGDYPIMANASTVQYETDVADNTLVADPVTVTVIGDVNRDRVVNVLDLILIANHLGHTQGDGHVEYTVDWYKCMNTDLNWDGQHNILDLIIAANHLGQHWP